MRHQSLSILLVLLALIHFSSCSEDDVLDSGNVNLSFSQDSILFDTLFTSVGSITKSIKVFNTKDQAVEFDLIKLANTNSPFSVNINGVSANQVKGMRIEAKDSIYIFVKATIDPTTDNLPFIVENHLQLITGNKSWIVPIEAWGQNANYIGSLATNSKITCNNSTEVWNDPKPYVIYGTLEIDSCTLEIMEGSNIYLHGAAIIDGEAISNDGWITVGKNGRIHALGSLNKPINFQGDRLDPPYDNVPGGWKGITLQNESSNNIFNYTTIKGAIVGLQADSASSATLSKSRIYRSYYQNIIAKAANLTVENCLIYGSLAGDNILHYGGGNYQYDYTTVSQRSELPNSFKQTLILSDQNCLNNEFNCIDEVFDLTFTANNSIFYHDGQDALSIDGSTDNIEFNHVAINSTTYEGSNLFTNSLFNIDTVFWDAKNDDFHLDSLTIVRTAGTPSSFIEDIVGSTRSNTTPSLGAFEYVD